MVTSSRGRRIVPLVLGLAMLAVVVAAGLTPNAGLVQAQSNSQYNQSPSSSGLSPWVWGAIAIVAVAVILLAALIALRRRRPPAAAPPPPMAAWQAGPSAPTAPAAPPAPPAAPPPPAAAPAYLETPEDVGVPPPSVPVSKVAAAGAGAAAAGAAGAVEAEPDIDSLMAELDKISGEILKRAPKKGSGTQAEPTDEEPKP